jgi:hypothetical protein
LRLLGLLYEVIRILRNRIWEGKYRFLEKSDRKGKVKLREKFRFGRENRTGKQSQIREEKSFGKQS